VGNPLDFTTPAEYQFKNLQMQVQTFPKTISEADKLNGIQWQGMVSLSADVYRERPIGGKEWSRWSDGFAYPVAFDRHELSVEQRGAALRRRRV